MFSEIAKWSIVNFPRIEMLSVKNMVLALPFVMLHVSCRDCHDISQMICRHSSNPVFNSPSFVIDIHLKFFDILVLFIWVTSYLSPNICIYRDDYPDHFHMSKAIQIHFYLYSTTLIKRKYLDYSAIVLPFEYWKAPDRQFVCTTVAPFSNMV